MEKNEHGVKGKYHRSRIAVFTSGGSRKFVPSCCLVCLHYAGNHKCGKGIFLPEKSGTCKKQAVR